MTATTDAPDTAAVADALDVDAERLEQFVASEPEPTPSVLLGWALAHPRHVDTVAAWLRARREERRVRSAVAAGWRHSYDLSPFQNLRALVELVEADRRAYGRFAYPFILGYGPDSTPRALDRLGVTP